MNICVLDVETTFQIDEKRRTDPTPYHPDNYLVSVGAKLPNDTYYICFKHNEKPTSKNGVKNLQDILDTADLMVWHNGKFDRSWLLECGFNVPIPCWDTMIAEYVLSCGLKRPLSLKETCIRRNLTRKKTDLTQEYLDKGIGFEAMPWAVVREYGIGDLISTEELFWAQLEDLEIRNVEDVLPKISL